MCVVFVNIVNNFKRFRNAAVSVAQWQLLFIYFKKVENTPIVYCVIKTILDTFFAVDDLGLYFGQTMCKGKKVLVVNSSGNEVMSPKQRSVKKKHRSQLCIEISIQMLNTQCNGVPKSITNFNILQPFNFTFFVLFIQRQAG